MTIVSSNHAGTTTTHVTRKAVSRDYELEFPKGTLAGGGSLGKNKSSPSFAIKVQDGCMVLPNTSPYLEKLFGEAKAEEEKVLQYPKVEISTIGATTGGATVYNVCIIVIFL